MKPRWTVAVAIWVAGLSVAGPVWAGWPGDLLPKCTPDSSKVGSVCVDKYEASVWQIPATNLLGKSNTSRINKVKKGVATISDLVASDATQLGVSSDDYPLSCPDTGQGCADVYAVSLVGIIPSSRITWFQAQQACANSNKRLPSNAEWQMAVSGTPDPGTDNGSTDCSTSTALAAVNTGSRSSCVSRWGNFDMVGNLLEWVADWVPSSTACPGWGAFSATGDAMCFSGASTTATGPGALLRGGEFSNGPSAGPLSVTGFGLPSTSNDDTIGFRCAR